MADMSVARQTSMGKYILFPSAPSYLPERPYVTAWGSAFYCRLAQTSGLIRFLFVSATKFASRFLQLAPHDVHLAFSYDLGLSTRSGDFHPLENVHAMRTKNALQGGGQTNGVTPARKQDQHGTDFA